MNLVADPGVAVQVGGDRFVARARTATAAEMERLWPTMTAILPLYDSYQAQSSRDIPLVIVEQSPVRAS